jgi:uncharacterized membrane protein YcaP (DUF421 family)
MYYFHPETTINGLTGATNFSYMLEKLFEISGTTFWFIILNAIGIYLAVIIFTRIAGKRSFSKMSSFDFAMTVAIGSILATVILSSSTSLAEGLVGLGIVYILQITVAIARRNNTPLLLMNHHKVLNKNLRKARVSESDLRSKLREANVLNRSQIRAVVFEATGDISVLHTSDEKLEIEEWLMQGVDH